MYWGFGCISMASAKQGFQSDAATAFATSVLGTFETCRRKPPERSGLFPVVTSKSSKYDWRNDSLCHGGGCSSWRSQMDMTVNSRRTALSIDNT
jgi:hypothetical protein